MSSSNNRRCYLHFKKNDLQTSTSSTSGIATIASNITCTTSNKSTESYNCDTFIPDYTKVVDSIEPLTNIMRCAAKDLNDKSRRRVIGLLLLPFRKMQEEKDRLFKPNTKSQIKTKNREKVLQVFMPYGEMLLKSVLCELIRNMRGERDLFYCPNLEPTLLM